MFCSNCGAPNNDGVKFCSNCGQPLSPVEQSVADQPKPKKLSILCLLGFIFSMVFDGTIAVIACMSLLSPDSDIGATLLVFVLPGLVLSIVGIILASVKKQRGKGFGIAGAILSTICLVIVLSGPVSLETYRSNYKDNYDDDYEYETEWTTKWTTEETTEWTTEPTTEATRETTEETTKETTIETTTEATEGTTEPSGSMKGTVSVVGNEKTGTITLVGNWFPFKEAGGFSDETIEHEQVQSIDNGAIIGLFVVNTKYSAEEMTKLQMASMEQGGAIGVTGARVKISGRDAFQCYGMYPDGTVLVCWYFTGEDGYIRKISVEFTENSYDVFTMVENGYKF